MLSWKLPRYRVCIEDEDPNARCGDGETCLEGVSDSDDKDGETPDPDLEPEHPTTLPETGTGRDAGEMKVLIGLNLAAGAVAGVAGKRRPRSVDTTGE